MVQYLDELDKLELSRDKYVIIGSGSLVAYGLEVKNNDLDIILKPGMLAILVNENILKPKVKPIKNEQDELFFKLVFVNDTEHIEVCNNVINDIDSCNPLDYYIKSSANIDGYSYLPLVPLKYFYKCLYKRYRLEKFKKKIDLLK